MTVLRYGIIGGGFVAAFHMRAMCQLRGIEIGGILTNAPVDKLLEFARSNQLGDAKQYHSVTEMTQDVDVICLFGKHYKRVEVLEEVLQAVQKGAQISGIICEKPFARNMPEARRMMELSEAIGVPTAYFENQVHMGAVTSELQQLIPVMNEMGPLTLVRSAEEHGGAQNDWFWDPRIAGGGVMNDMGCHCLAVGWYALTPPGKPVRFLEPQSIVADLALLKWGEPRWQKLLQDRYNINFWEAPAEDFATGVATFKNPESGQYVKAQFTSSWMYDMRGIRLYLDGIGPGYALEMNTLLSPSQIFISDKAASSISESESALEKAQSSQGLLTILPNEPDIYGYTDENREAFAAFSEGRSALLDFRYGLEIVKLTMAGYMSAERGRTIDLTDPAIQKELETFIPMVQQGRGRELYPVQPL